MRTGSKLVLISEHPRKELVDQLAISVLARVEKVPIGAVSAR